ncbi:MAG: hypothetical protein ACTSQJ_15255, partial [Promethearchaeota archaeon]
MVFHIIIIFLFLGSLPLSYSLWNYKNKNSEQKVKVKHYLKDDQYRIKINYCPECGKKIEIDNPNYCYHCGEKIF